MPSFNRAVLLLALFMLGDDAFGQFYFHNGTGGVVVRRDLDGANPVTILTQQDIIDLNMGLTGYSDLATDGTNAKLYWRSGAPNAGQITLRSNLDGSDIEIVLSIADATGLSSHAVFSPPPGPLPAVGEWGTMYAVLLILTGGTVVFARRSRATSSVLEGQS